MKPLVSAAASRAPAPAAGVRRRLPARPAPRNSRDAARELAQVAGAHGTTYAEPARELTDLVCLRYGR